MSTLAVVLGRRRLVRLHLKSGGTVEGIQQGRSTAAGHYMLLVPKILETVDDSTALEGHLEVPRENVEFRQILQ